jgi:hypothetical protein
LYNGLNVMMFWDIKSPGSFAYPKRANARQAGLRLSGGEDVFGSSFTKKITDN